MYPALRYITFTVYKQGYRFQELFTDSGQLPF